MKKIICLVFSFPAMGIGYIYGLVYCGFVAGRQRGFRDIADL